jgi:hypothetical protein
MTGSYFGTESISLTHKLIRVSQHSRYRRLFGGRCPIDYSLGDDDNEEEEGTSLSAMSEDNMLKKVQYASQNDSPLPYRQKTLLD